MTTMSDLPEDLVGEILSRVPTTSLRSVRATCKNWNALTKTQTFFAKAVAARHQYMGFMMMDSRVCYLKFNLQGTHEDDDGDFVAPSGSITQISIPNEVDISQIFHCDGLLLCVNQENSRLFLWNPYLGQIRWIPVRPVKIFPGLSMYAFGYDNVNRNYKILRFFEESYHLRCEIHDFISNSWKVLDTIPDMDPWCHQPGVSLKGNTYFFAQKDELIDYEGEIPVIAHSLLCFDFTTESFGLRLPLPTYSFHSENVALSCVREEQLAVLYNRWHISEVAEIWITTKIEPNTVSWSKFLKVDRTPLNGSLDFFEYFFDVGIFFIDEEKKVAVVFHVDVNLPTKTYHYHKAYIIGEDGYVKFVSIRQAPWLKKLCVVGYARIGDYLPLVCSSYVPSLVQLNINRPGLRREQDY